ncbi:hypothetical protein O6H91_Y552700 [Diphasiastrum complanatum]|nr:hypothetical protein O6H91_Y552700 [Diphasiastrum complanatum]
MTRGKPEKTFAMKAGSARHLELEIEFSTKVEVEVQSKEDSWAIRMVNFIIGTRQLYAEGLTRELPVLGLLESTWLVGVIDELRMCDMGGVQCPLLVDTKTRLRPSPPSEAQKRNARLQLMCYKLIWDTMTQKGISSEIFYECFDLRPHKPLSESVKCHVDRLAMHLRVCNFEDVVQLFNEECLLLPSCHSSLLLRYEWQADQSILGEDEFPFELEWCTDRLKWHLEYWQGQRPATFVADDEHWKCNFCSFAGVCPAVNASVEEQTTCN